jgi:integrase
MARRRGNNEGSIYQRSNGTWRAQVRVQGPRLSTTVKTRHECQDWLKKTVSQIDGGLTFKGAKITLEEYLGNWLGDIQATIRTGTHNQYEMCCRDYIIPALGIIRLSALTPGHLQE